MYLAYVDLILVLSLHQFSGPHMSVEQFYDIVLLLPWLEYFFHTQYLLHFCLKSSLIAASQKMLF